MVRLEMWSYSMWIGKSSIHYAYSVLWCSVWLYCSY